MTQDLAKRSSSPTTTALDSTQQPKSPFATLKGLKQRTYRTWKSLYRIHAIAGSDLLPTTDEEFKQTMCQFGNLRCKATWENAWSALYAQLLAESDHDNVRLRRTFTSCAEAEGWMHLMPQVLDNFLETEEAIDRIRDGLERIYREEREFPLELVAFAQALTLSHVF